MQKFNKSYELFISVRVLVEEIKKKMNLDTGLFRR